MLILCSARAIYSKKFKAFRRELQVLAKRKLEMGEIHTSNNDDF
jgi:hypothetical protein